MTEEIIRITKDLLRAKELQTMALERMDDIIPILPKDKHYKIIEEYYEVLVQLMTGIMYAEGYKTLSHISLIEYLSRRSRELTDNQIKLIDTLRKFRHGTVYYAKKVGEEFLVNHEEEICNVIALIDNILETLLKKGKKI